MLSNLKRSSKAGLFNISPVYTGQVSQIFPRVPCDVLHVRISITISAIVLILLFTKRVSLFLQFEKQRWKNGICFLHRSISFFSAQTQPRYCIAHFSIPLSFQLMPGHCFTDRQNVQFRNISCIFFMFLLTNIYL